MGPSAQDVSMTTCHHDPAWSAMIHHHLEVATRKHTWGMLPLDVVSVFYHTSYSPKKQDVHLTLLRNLLVNLEAIGDKKSHFQGLGLSIPNSSTVNLRPPRPQHRALPHRQRLLPWRDDSPQPGGGACLPWRLEEVVGDGLEGMSVCCMVGNWLIKRCWEFLNIYYIVYIYIMLHI